MRETAINARAKMLGLLGEEAFIDTSGQDRIGLVLGDSVLMFSVSTTRLITGPEAAAVIAREQRRRGNTSSKPREATGGTLGPVAVFSVGDVVSGGEKASLPTPEAVAPLEFDMGRAADKPERPERPKKKVIGYDDMPEIPSFLEGVDLTGAVKPAPDSSRATDEGW